uniref:Retinoic acid receptor responder protein 3-like n=2 Tax=Populus TaxID=3689 RepID=A0A4U5MPT1_POPAL|nr:phospholipase A and acyltransferase 4-like [Populus alba]TKR71312.1 retinoic acid receptor responder protein 3-like [Populus alba]
MLAARVATKLGVKLGVLPDHFQHDISRWDIGQIPEGLHIYVHRPGYTHHGIYIGDGKVIHFVGPKAGPTRACKKCGFSRNTGHGVVETCLECFLHGGSLCRYNYNVPRIRLRITFDATCPNCTTTERWESGSQIVETAKEKLKEGFGKYNLLSNNCEHFATFCSTGTAFCQQVIHTAALAAAPLLPPAPGLLMFYRL